MTKRILVGGIGNIFLGDDAFGVEVVRELSKQPVPQGVCIKDFGIRSYDLAFALAEGYDHTILIDATRRGQPPGTLYLLRPELDDGEGGGEVDGHSLHPAQALQMARAWGENRGSVYLVGCEPEVLECEQMGLSPSVQASIPEAMGMVVQLLGELQGQPVSGKSPLLSDDS